MAPFVAPRGFLVKPKWEIIYMAAAKRGGAAAALLVVTLTGFEGVRQHAYPDPATHGKPWTICMGHTEGVRPGDYKTLEECKRLLLEDSEKYSNGMEACIKGHLPDRTWVAFTSFAYNVGVGAFCRSEVVRQYNAGHHQAACDALLRYNRAAGIVFPGLTTRRQKERALCLQGLKEAA